MILILFIFFSSSNSHLLKCLYHLFICLLSNPLSSSPLIQPLYTSYTLLDTWQGQTPFFLPSSHASSCKLVRYQAFSIQNNFFKSMYLLLTSQGSKILICLHMQLPPGSPSLSFSISVEYT